MASDSETNAKHHALQATGTFNPRAAQVHHPLFQQSEFFDPHDLLQLKYETVRAIQVDGCPIAQAARQFGLSRPTIYQAQFQFQEHGLEGLLPHKRGPQNPHKLTPEVCQFLLAQKTAEPQLTALDLAQRVRHRFQISLHPRTIEKAWQPQAKRGRRR
jgi:transposase